MRAYDKAKVFYGIGGGIRQSMSFWDLKRLPVIAPVDSEARTKIVKYLDQETRRIDDLVKLNEKVIDLLQERRNALISAAATGKIDLSNFE